MLDLLLGRAGVWLAGVLVLFGSFGTGYLRGKLDEQEKQKIAWAEVIVKQMERVRTVYVNDGKVSEAYEKGKREREDEFNRLKAQLESSKLEAMPVSCDFPDDVIRLLNTPRASGLSSDTKKPAGSMRWATSLAGR